MTKALGRPPNVVTMGQFYRALTVGNAARGQKKPKGQAPGQGSGAAADALSTWVPVAPPRDAWAAPDPFLWLELSGLVWCRARAVDGLWQALVDRVENPQMQRLLVPT
jgi:hypothetical protein